MARKSVHWGHHTQILVASAIRLDGISSPLCTRGPPYRYTIGQLIAKCPFVARRQEFTLSPTNSPDGKDEDWKSRRLYLETKSHLFVKCDFIEWSRAGKTVSARLWFGLTIQQDTFTAGRNQE
ncbi:hypothetical protein TNIN_149191 [Trichonephila inaurata madagascariensis]|uniref:Uncharacterized protein n=1 Tax=Trichonephila inaurata madagascariensis TaxID=2747483 RepID=A0A8X6X8J3_9ARAC|nr:hypothetical protein TNIN_149191 [Trichonephila inaurata madagascariensis]